MTWFYINRRSIVNKYNWRPIKDDNISVIKPFKERNVLQEKNQLDWHFYLSFTSDNCPKFSEFCPVYHPIQVLVSLRMLQHLKLFGKATETYLTNESYWFTLSDGTSDFCDQLFQLHASYQTILVRVEKLECLKQILIRVCLSSIRLHPAARSRWFLPWVLQRVVWAPNLTLSQPIALSAEERMYKSQLAMSTT